MVVLFWIGEISVKLGSEMNQYIQIILQPLIMILNKPNTPKTLLVSSTDLYYCLINHSSM